MLIWVTCFHPGKIKEHYYEKKLHGSVVATRWELFGNENTSLYHIIVT